MRKNADLWWKMLSLHFCSMLWCIFLTLLLLLCLDLPPTTMSISPYEFSFLFTLSRAHAMSSRGCCCCCCCWLVEHPNWHGTFVHEINRASLSRERWNSIFNFLHTVHIFVCCGQCKLNEVQVPLHENDDKQEKMHFSCKNIFTTNTYRTTWCGYGLLRKSQITKCEMLW